MRRFEIHLADTDENQSLYYARLILIELKNCIPIALACVPEKLFQIFFHILKAIFQAANVHLPCL